MIHKELLGDYASEYPHYVVESSIEYIEPHMDITYMYVPQVGTVIMMSNSELAKQSEVSDNVIITKRRYKYIMHNLSKTISGIVNRKI